jgi:DNA-binding CsgD family transcriptional regulator
MTGTADASGTLHHVILRGMERGQMVAAREDRESFLARLGLSLADTARQLGVSISGIAKAVQRAERPSVH